MSLINQMLQDLEKRGQTGTEMPAPRYTQFSNQAAAPSHPWRWRLAVLLVLGVALVWVYFFQGRSTTVQPAVVQTAASSTNAALVLVSAPTTEPALPVLGDLSLKLSKDVDVRNVTLTETSQSAPEVKVQVPVAMIEKPAVSVQSVQKEALVRTDTTSTKAAASASTSQNAAPVAIVKETSTTQRAETEYRQATSYTQQGRQSEALSALQQALKLDPQHMPARQALISMLIDMNRQEEAIRELKHGLALDPNQSNFAMILARLQVERANVNEAIITLQASLPTGQDRADYLAFLAALKQKTGAHKEAIQLYRQALKKHQTNGVWWMGLGISLQADGAPQDAIEAFKQAKTQPGLSAELQAFVDQKIASLQK
ncbi:MAG: tetratricopeptide repeat protein [Burkholderiales bacterium]|nr:tetratricopeptide repeat protein [Burkholderiales bacterium]